MKDNHCVIMDKCPSNQLIAIIYMTSNRMVPLTLNPTKKNNTTLVVGKAKYVQWDTAFTTEIMRSSNEENIAPSVKKR